MTRTTTSCQATTAHGQPCRAPAQSGSPFCFSHDPARAVDRLDAQSKGGRARHGRQLGTRTPAAPVSVKTTGDIVRLLEQTINDALCLENSLSRAKTIGYLVLAACKALELNELADRVAAVETVLKMRDAR